MPFSKFFGKSKEDLVLLATLGNVLTQERASEMSQTELATFLFKIDQEFETKSNKNKIKISREKKPLIKEEKKKTTSPKKKEKTGVSISTEIETPVIKLSKRELNKQLFMQELAAKSSEKVLVDVVDVPETKPEIAVIDTSSNKKRNTIKKLVTVSLEPEVQIETNIEPIKKTKVTRKEKDLINKTVQIDGSDIIKVTPANNVISKPDKKPARSSAKNLIKPQEENIVEVIEEKIIELNTVDKSTKKSQKSSSKAINIKTAKNKIQDIKTKAPATAQTTVTAIEENTSAITNDVAINEQSSVEIMPEKLMKTAIIGQALSEKPGENSNVVIKEAKRILSKRIKSNETKSNVKKSDVKKSENDIKEPVETVDIATVEIKSKVSNVKKPFKKPVTNINENSNPSEENKAETLIDAISQTDNEKAEAKSEAPKTEVPKAEENSSTVDKDTHTHKPAHESTHEKHHRHINKPTSHESTEGGSDLPEDGEKKKHEKVIAPPEILEMVEGALEIMPDGYGFLRKNNYLQGPKDIYIPPQYIRRFGLRPGDWITGPGKLQRETDRYQAILYIKEVNGLPPEKMIGRPQFDQLTPIYPDVRFVLETGRNELSTRIIDLVAPIGKGQRGMIVSPPKAGKTILLQKIANAIATNNPEAKLIVLLIDERPEEVTDMQRSINGEVVFSTFDKTPENHVKVVELVLERSMRLVELGQDVVILLDSITRLARAYNLTINPTGRTLSGGLDPGALYGPKRFFGSARNIENGGSLTIIATSLIDTGSRMDEVIFEEFKGTGNMEVYLDRKLSEKRIFPAIDLNRSGTRREELLLSKRELDAVWTIRKAFGQLDTSAVTEMIINLLLKTNNNSHFVSSVNVSLNDKAMFDAMRGTKPGGSGSNSAGGNMNSSGNNYGNNGNYGNQ